MRVAVVGAGVAGITSALALSKGAEVTVFEKESRLGGHAHTHRVSLQGDDIFVDSGFMVFNPPRYPVFMKLLDYLGIESTPTTMSFSVSIPGEVEYSSRFPRGIFSSVSKMVSPTYIAFLFEIARFNRIAKKVLAANIAAEISLNDFIAEHRFSSTLQRWYLFPMLAAIWSCPEKFVRGFPARATFTFLNNHSLLSLSPDAPWQTISGGSRRYVHAATEKLLSSGAQIRYDAQIESISRTSESVTIKTRNSIETFDYLVMATHADDALALLSEPSTTEREILGAFSYSSNEAVLHSDTSLMPKSRRVWASWNYIAGNSNGNSLFVTYNMNSLQHIRETPMYVSLNSSRPVDEKLVHARISYRHPQFDLKALKAQKRLGEIQNKNRTLFAGAHWGYGFHEDGARSGLEAGEALGISAPWK
jgi:predicted NAD/FAD-binding protein